MTEYSVSAGWAVLSIWLISLNDCPLWHPGKFARAVDSRSFDESIYMRAADVCGPDVHPVRGLPTDVLSLRGSNAEAAQAQLPHRAM